MCGSCSVEHKIYLLYLFIPVSKTSCCEPLIGQQKESEENNRVAVMTIPLVYPLELVPFTPVQPYVAYFSFSSALLENISEK